MWREIRPLARKTPVWNHVLVSTGGTLDAASMLSPVGNAARSHQAGEIFRIELVDPAEAAELALDPVIVAVVVGVAG